MSRDQHLWEIQPVRDLAILVIVVLVLWALYVARSVTTPVIIGLALAYVFNPFVSWSNQHAKIPRWCTALIIISVVLLVIIGIMWWTLPPLIGQIDDLTKQLPGYLEYVGTVLGIELNWDSLSQQIHNAANPDAAAKFEGRGAAVGSITEYAGPIGTAVKHMYAFTVSMVGSVASMVTYVPLATVIIAFCFFFFSWHWSTIVDWFDQFIPPASRAQTIDVLRKMDRSVSAFIRGRLIQASVMGVILSIGWAVTDVPYSLLLGLGCGLLNLVPFLAIIGWIGALMLTLVDHMSEIEHAFAEVQRANELAGEDPTTLAKESFRWAVLIGPTIVYVLAQLFDGWAVEPLVQGKATNLDPLTVLLSVLVGATLAGLLGMVLAIPTAACIKILGQEVIVPRIRQYAQKSEPM